jgi:prophage regulatory protein
MQDQIKIDRLIDKKELKKLIPYSHSTITRKEKAGSFPKRVILGPCRVAWPLSEVLQWIENKKAERDHLNNF